MNAADREELRQVLLGYFGDQSLETGVRELVGVSVGHPACHQRYRTALEAGLQAARAGDQDVYPIVREIRAYLRDMAAVANAIEEILRAYDHALCGESQGVSGLPGES